MAQNGRNAGLTPSVAAILSGFRAATVAVTQQAPDASLRGFQVQQLLHRSGFSTPPASYQASSSHQVHPFMDSQHLKSLRCGQCINCFRQNNCDKCVNCLAKRQPCLRRVCVQSGLIPQPLAATPDEKPLLQKKPTKKIGRPRKPKEEKVAPKRKVKTAQTRSKARRESQSKVELIVEEEIPRQCYGPRCTAAARPGSKYCCDECGLALAQKRFDLLLPQRIQDYYGQSPMWKVETEEKTDNLRHQQAITNEAMKRVEECGKNLDLYFGTLASGKPSFTRNSQSDEDTSFPHGCMVCGVEVPVSYLPRHIQRCFVRLEKQSTFGSTVKFFINPYNVLCEKYDKTSKTYCKRLRVICSEHYRDDIGRDFKLCGYPLAWARMQTSTMEELFLNMDVLADGMCMSERKSCDQHFMWEQTAAAIVENQRMQYLLKLDEISECYRRLAESSSTQRNAIALLMNSRKQHTPLPSSIQEKVGAMKSVKTYCGDSEVLGRPSERDVQRDLNHLSMTGP